jgi:hypothetical protein
LADRYLLLNEDYAPLPGLPKEKDKMSRVLYKAVPRRFLDSIRQTGLDPTKAGQSGGATSKAKLAGREEKPLDKNYTWLGDLENAHDYAVSWFSSDSPVILKVLLPDTFPPVDDHENGLYGTHLLIPPSYLYFQTAKGDYFLTIASYKANFAYIYVEE